MRWSKTLIPTMKETPEGAEVPSHVLMLRAGLVSQLMAGAYTFLPLGVRSLHKAMRIVREEMDAAGAVEVEMPCLTPINLWEQTGRVEAFGDVLIQLSVKRQGKQVRMALGPTHEEPVTDLASRYLTSYRQLPITLYQITHKFRNEERPRFGVLRTSEFLMKDAYSFNDSLESLNASYQAMYDAYCKIFTRCGLDFVPVEAESGPIGGDASHEFMIPATNGEDTVLRCPMCNYGANVEKAAIGLRHNKKSEAEPKEICKIPTPHAGSIEAVSKMLKCKPHQLIKTLIYMVDDQPMAILVRGDHEVNENKIRHVLKASKVELADPATILRVTGAPVGFAGPVGLKEAIPVWADEDIRDMVNVYTGANEADMHLGRVNPGRDFEPTGYGDFRNAAAGDGCPRCTSGILEEVKAIEVGHVFKLGTKYTDALSATFIDTEEKIRPIIMGCYGIGVTRILAGLIEISNDQHGIVWPMSLAPYEVVVTPVNVSDEAMRAASEKLYDELKTLGVEVLYDDRDARAGVKFKDADLIGFPLRVVVGKMLEQGKLELKWRWAESSEELDVTGAAQKIAAMVMEEKRTGAKFAARKR